MDHSPVPAPIEHMQRTGCPPGQMAATTACPDETELAAMLMHRYPGCLVWFGTLTRRWWAFAVIRGAWSLLEMQTADEVARALMTAVEERPSWPDPSAAWEAG